jgi:hypothetical protein
LPRVFIFFGEKMLDLTGMQTANQLFSIMDLEIEFLPADGEIIAIAYQ